LEGKNYCIIYRFLQGNFWHNYARNTDTGASIDALLSKDDCSIEQLLDQEKLIEVLKSYNNDKLIKL